MKRYDLLQLARDGISDYELEQLRADDGEWVKYEDVQLLEQLWTKVDEAVTADVTAYRYGQLKNKPENPILQIAWRAETSRLCKESVEKMVALHNWLRNHEHLRPARGANE